MNVQGVFSFDVHKYVFMGPVVNMKSRSLAVIFVLMFFLLSWSCTNTPWHRDQADAYLKKGVALLEVHQYLGALKELLEADKYAPDDPEINYHLGIAYLGRGLRDLALQRFQKAVLLKSDYSEAHNYIGAIYNEMGQWDKALPHFDKALANHLYANPEHALYNSGRSYYGLNDYDMAMQRFTEALRQDRFGTLRSEIEASLGLVYLKQSNRPQAIAHLERAVLLNPSLYDAHFFLGEAYLDVKDKVKAKKSFQQVVELAPQSPFGQKARNYLQSMQ